MNKLAYHVITIALSFVLLTFGAPGQAQSDEEFSLLWPNGECSDATPYDSNHPLAFERINLETDIKDAVIVGDWHRSGSIVRTRLEAFIASNNLDDNIDGDEDPIRSLLGAIDYYLAQPIQKTALWNPRDNFSETLILSLPSLPNGDIQRVEIDCSMVRPSPGKDFATTEEAVIAYSAASYGILSNAIFDFQSIGAGTVADIYNSYRNKLFNGLKMWPWETWINGITVDLESTDPKPASLDQWVFLRPGLSPAIKFDGNDSQLDAGLIVEPIGYVRYLDGEQFNRWIGFSPMITITNDNGVGYGALIRYGNMQLGTAYHDKEEDWLVYLSFDILSLIKGDDGSMPRADDFLDQKFRQLVGR